MVRKAAKYGVYSGNTLKASNSKFVRQYVTQSVLVRLVNDVQDDLAGDGTPVDNILREHDMNGHNVVYSLNKKGRWALPALLKAEILDGDYDDETFNVSLMERHKLKKDANCVSFCASKGGVRQFGKNTRKTYFNGNSLLNGISTDQGRRHRSNQSVEYHETADPSVTDDQVSVPNVRYEVLYPSPLSSSITHNPKYIRSRTVVIDSDGEMEPLSAARSKGKRKSRCHTVKVDYDEDNYETDYIESDLEDFCEQGDETDDPFSDKEKYTRFEESYDILLKDVLDSARKAKYICDDGMKRNHHDSKPPFPQQSKDYKGSVVFVDSEPPPGLGAVIRKIRESKYGQRHKITHAVPKESSENVHRGNTRTKPQTHQKFLQTKMEPVRVIIPSEDTCVSRLRNDFGVNFAECRCVPRKFILNLTDRVCNIVKSTKVFPANFSRIMDMSTFLVFEYDGEYDTGLDIFKVYINIKANTNSLKVHTLFDLVTCSLEDVVSRSLLFLETLPLDYFVKKSDLDTCRQTRTADVTFENMLSVSRWNMVTYDPYSVDILGVDASEMDGVSANFQPNDTETNCLIVPPKFCHICFESIKLTKADSVPATALTACGHWFCNSCWRDHLESRVSGGRLTLTCPEFDCHEVMDFGTALTLLNIGHLERFVKRIQENEIARADEKKWCPNPKCGRVIRASGIKHDGPVNVSCACGKELCFTCLKTAHWPVTCAEAKHYVKTLTANRDDVPFLEEPEATILGKNCPKCNSFIEKSGGCEHMTCFCGENFCWACGKRWIGHGTGIGCHQMTDSDGLKKHYIRRRDAVVQFADGNERTRYYQVALQHRLTRQPKNMKALKNTARQLGLRLRDLNAKHGDMIGRELEGFSCGTRTETVIKDKIPIFLNTMVSLIIELHHVLEYTAVLLDRRTNKKTKKLLCMFERMELLVQRITDIVLAGLNQDLRNVIRGLWQLRRFARENLRALVLDFSDA